MESNEQLYDQLVSYIGNWKNLKYHPDVAVKPNINCNEFIAFTKQF